jgi:hypothetical protein
MTALHGTQLFDFDGLINHGARDANQCANFFDSVGPLLEGTLRRGGGVFRAVSEADVRAPPTNMDAALFVPEHRSPDGDDEITHPCAGQRTSSEAVEYLQVLS